MRRVIFGFVAAWGLTLSSFGATLTVDFNGGADYMDIQSAIDAAADGDTVLVKPGEYVITEPINFNRLHDPENPASPPVRNIVVKSEGGAQVTTIRMAETPTNPQIASVVIFHHGETNRSHIEDFTLTGGQGTTDFAGGVGVLKGGVLFRWSSCATLINCTISGNSATGSVYCEGNCSPSFFNCTITNNSGTGLFIDGGASPTLADCTITGNCGGVFCSSDSSPTLINCIVWGNAAESLVVNEGSQPNVSFSCLETEDVWPGDGNINQDPLFCGWGERGEVWVDASKPGRGDGSQESPLTDPREATRYSLAISAGSPCLGTGKEGADMGADTGRCEGPIGKARIVHLAPGIYAAEDVRVVHNVCLVGAGEVTTVIEGTIFGLRTGSSLSNLTITKGASIGHIGSSVGIVISAGESPEIANCTISGNSALGWGGGVVCEEGSSPTFTNCTISGNSVGWGGGVVCEEGSSPTFTNCTISGNSASLEGGGVYCWFSSPILTNCTISGNSADDGGGVFCPSPFDSLALLMNCIVWGNTPDSGYADLVFCLIDEDPLFVQEGEWVDCESPEDPECIAYQWNPETGEPTAWHRWVFDYHLQPGSPCIDAGTSEGAPTTDIEGHGRPCGKGVDIGAYEFGDCPVSGIPFRRGDVDGNASLEITDPIKLLGYEFLGEPAPACLDAADANDDGQLDISDAIYSLSFQFLGGPAPESPFPECDIDPLLDDLDCQSYPSCQ